MKMTRFLPLASIVTLSALFLAGSSVTLRAQASDSPKINNLLSDAKNHAKQIEGHADTLQTYTRSSLTWQSHAAQLDQMKEHVNDLGKIVKELNEARTEGSPWQQEAIDRINPLLQEMANQLTSTIRHMNDNQNSIHMQKYRDYAADNYDLAVRTSAVISDLVDYSKAKSKAETLERELELPMANNPSN